MSEQQTLNEIVLDRLEELGIPSNQLPSLLGIKNASKQAAFLQQLYDGDTKHMTHWRRPLVDVLGIPAERVNAAINFSKRIRFEALDKARRQSFVPHAVLVTERVVPHPIFIAAITGADRKLRIDFPQGIRQLNWPRFVAAQLPRGLPGFGLVTGFAINYDPDRAVIFDLDARPLEVLSRALRVGSTKLFGVHEALFKD